MEVWGHLESGILKPTMSPDGYRSKKLHLRNLGITRVVLFGLALSALATLMWLRMDIRPQLWPKLLDALHVDALDRGAVDDAVPPKVTLQQGNPAQGRSPAMVNSGSDKIMDSVVSSSSAADNVDVDVGVDADVDLGVDVDVDVDCLSRSQQYKYRKKEYHFPLSQALTRALAEYTRMHSQCCAGKIQLADHEHDGKEAAGGCQYVVYQEGYEGLGNRLLSLVAAFTYALVTNRALVIDATRGHLAQLLCEPFPNYRYSDKEKNNYDSNNSSTATWLLPSQVAHGVQRQAVTLEEAMRAQFVNVTAVHVNLRHEQTVGDRQFFCWQAQQGLQKVPWVIWESNQYYVPRLFMLREFWATKLHPWFPDVSRVFTQLGRVLCVPRNAVWHAIQHVQEAEMAWGPATAQVGIQVRRHGVSDNASFSEAVYKRIVECVVDGGVVPPPTMTTTTTTTERRTTKVAVLVTSLQSMYCDKMRERWNDTVVGNGGQAQVKFVMLSHDGTEQYSLEQARKALLEMWLLSLCNDALATSSWSTFGYVAQALAGMHPRILNIRGAHPELAEPALPACSLGQSPEPCLHYPFAAMAATASSSCLATTASAAAPAPASMMAPSASPSPISTNMAMAPLQQQQRQHQQHARWVTRHIRACQDETRGFQLVA